MNHRPALWLGALVVLAATGCGDDTQASAGASGGMGGASGPGGGGGGASSSPVGSPSGGPGVVSNASATVTAGTSSSSGEGGSGAGGASAATTGSAGEGGADPCGNGQVDEDELCDQDALDGQTCALRGFDAGELGCFDDCTFDTTDCVLLDCGDVLVDCDDPRCATVCADACASPPTLGDPAVDVPGSTIGHADGQAASCAESSGPEVIYRFEPAFTGVLDLALLAPSADLGLSVRTSCAGGELACAEAAGAGGTEVLTVPVSAGVTVFIVVDGRQDAEAGAFTLSASSRPILCGDGLREGGEACDDGNPDDADGCSSVCLFECGVLACDDGNACTLDGCSAETGCGASPISPEDGNACTSDGCDPQSGVTNTPIDPNDGDACTSDACNPQSGVSNTPVSCQDGDACTVDGCDPGSGCTAGLPAQPHDACTTGAPLVDAPGCAAGAQGVISAVCAANASCCQGAWDFGCVQQVESAGGSGACAGSCAHAPCAVGDALAAGCSSCVASVCAVDSFCCNNSWDSICVGEVASVCGLTCN